MVESYIDNVGIIFEPMKQRLETGVKAFAPC